MIVNFVFGMIILIFMILKGMEFIIFIGELLIVGDVEIYYGKKKI